MFFYLMFLIGLAIPENRDSGPYFDPSATLKNRKTGTRDPKKSGRLGAGTLVGP